ncbi:MAG: nitrogen fixation protein NifX [Pseudomonadota bacterium]
MSRRLRLIESGAPGTDEVGEKALRVAIATNDMENLDAHFGSATKFAIYDVTTTDATFVEAVGFDDVTSQSGKHDDIDDKITPKVNAVRDCALLFALAIGGPSAAKVVKAGVHPIKRKAAEPISAVLIQVQTMLQGTPPPFLRKILGRDDKPSFMDEYESEGI